MLNRIYGSRSVSKRGRWYTHPSCIRTLAADAREKSALHISISKFTPHSVRRRTQFTEEDEERLCDWIAAKIPYKETGGRTGNRLYQQLCDMVCRVPDFPVSCSQKRCSQMTRNSPGLHVIHGSLGVSATRRTRSVWIH